MCYLARCKLHIERGMLHLSNHRGNLKLMFEIPARYKPSQRLWHRSRCSLKAAGWCASYNDWRFVLSLAAQFGQPSKRSMSKKLRFKNDCVEPHGSSQHSWTLQHTFRSKFLFESICVWLLPPSDIVSLSTCIPSTEHRFVSACDAQEAPIRNLRVKVLTFHLEMYPAATAWTAPSKNSAAEP